MLTLTVCVAAGYLLGSISFSAIAARRAGIDIRRVGSGNPGATNVVRTIGSGPGLAVFLGDLLKGSLAALLPLWVRLDPPPVSTEGVRLLAGLAAVVGHVWPVFSRFRGGKGVATGAGVVLAVHPWAFALCGATFAVLLRATRWVSVASMGSALALLAILTVLRVGGWAHPSSAFLAFGTVASALIVFAHRSNLAKLRSGTEPKV